MIGIDMRINPSSIIKALQEERILSLKAGVTTIRFLPPYMITYDDMRNTVDTLRKIFQKIEMKAA